MRVETEREREHKKRDSDRERTKQDSVDREKIIIEKLEYLSGQQISKIAESFLALIVVAKMLHCC